MLENLNSSTPLQDEAAKFSYYKYDFDLEEVDPLEGIKKISKTIGLKSGSPIAREDLETELEIFALLISRANEANVPFGSIVEAIDQTTI